MTAMQEVIEPWSTGPNAFQAGPDSPGCAAYQAVWTHLLRLAFHDEIPEDYWPEGGSRWFEVVRGLLENPKTRSGTTPGPTRSRTVMSFWSKR